MALTTLDPWREKGIPLEKQIRSWKARVLPTARQPAWAETPVARDIARHG